MTRMTNSLPYVVQYRRKVDGIYWDDMAAFDVLSVAESYRDKCADDNSPWEYKVDNRSKIAEAAE